VGNTQFKTDVHNNGGRSPTWNSKYVFDVRDTAKSYMKIQIFNKRGIREDKLISEGRFPVSMFGQDVLDQWLPLNASGSNGGEIHVRGALFVPGQVPNPASAPAPNASQAMPPPVDKFSNAPPMHSQAAPVQQAPPMHNQVPPMQQAPMMAHGAPQQQPMYGQPMQQQPMYGQAPQQQMMYQQQPMQQQYMQQQPMQQGTNTVIIHDRGGGGYGGGYGGGPGMMGGGMAAPMMAGGMGLIGGMMIGEALGDDGGDY